MRVAVRGVVMVVVRRVVMVEGLGPWARKAFILGF